MVYRASVDAIDLKYHIWVDGERAIISGQSGIVLWFKTLCLLQ